MNASDLKPGIIVRGPVLPEPPAGTTMSQVEETKVVLRELGLREDVSIKRGGGS